MFWEQQVNDLMTGIGGLGGFNAPLDIPRPDPTLPPCPAPSYYPRMPTLDDPAPDVPQHLPYIPEQDMDTSNYQSLRPARVETQHGVAMTLRSERL